MRNRLVSVFLVLSACGLTFAPAAAAIEKCEGNVSQRTVATGLGVLESLISGGGGKMYVSSTSEGFDDPAKLLRFAAPGADARTIATAGPGPGGLAWNGRRLLWGNGNTQANGESGDADPRATLLSVHPRTGKYFTWARGLGMANGVARAKNGVVFASNDFGSKLDRISRKGATRHGWADVESGNGMVVGRNGRYLFVNQTFTTPGAIVRVEIANPSNVSTFFSSADAGVPFPALDGLARDEKNNLYAAAWITGEVWKITPDRRACVLATGIPQISNLAFGGGKKGFVRGSLYATNFLGDLVEIKGARRASAPVG